MGEDPKVTAANHPEWRPTMASAKPHRAGADVVAIWCSCRRRRPSKMAEVVRTPDGSIFWPPLDAVAERDESSSPSLRHRTVVVPFWAGANGVLRLGPMPREHEIALTCPKCFKPEAEVRVGELLSEVDAALRSRKRRNLTR